MKFREDESQPIVSSLLRQGFLPNYDEALEEIDKSEAASRVDTVLSLGGVAVGLASTCGILALSSISAPIIVPATAVLGCAIAAWNSRSTEFSREAEGEFLRDFPQILALIEAKDKQGVTEGRIASAYNQAFKAYRYGELDDLVQRFEGSAKNHVLRDIPDDKIEDKPKTATPAKESKPVTKKQIGDHLFSSLPQSKKAEVAALAKQSPRKAIDYMMQLHGLTLDDLEKELPGAKAVLSESKKPVDSPAPSFVNPEPIPPTSKVVRNPGSHAALDLITSEPFQSLATIGGQRSGKTYLLSLVTAKLKATIGTKIIYINLYDPNHDAHEDWGHADVCITGHLRKMGEHEAQKLIEKTTKAIDQFAHDVNAVVVFDEWVQFTHISNGWSKKLSQEIQYAKSMTSKGDSYVEPEGIGHSATELMNAVCAISGELSNIGKKQLKAIHLVAPSFVAGNVEQQGKVMKSLKPLVVAIPPERSISWTHPKAGITQEITFDAAGYEVSQPNFPIPHPSTVPSMECDRMAYFNGQWISLDGLPSIKTPDKNVPKLENKPTAIDDPWEEAEAKTGQDPQQILAKLESAGITLQDISTLLKAIAPNG